MRGGKDELAPSDCQCVTQDLSGIPECTHLGAGGDVSWGFSSWKKTTSMAKGRDNHKGVMISKTSSSFPLQSLYAMTFKVGDLFELDGNP